MKEEIRRLLVQILENQQHILERLNSLERRLFAEESVRPATERAGSDDSLKDSAQSGQSPGDRLWAQVLERMSGRISEESLEMWLKPLAVCGVDGESLDLLGPDRFSAEWVASRYGKMMEESLPEGDICRIRVGWKDETGDIRWAESGEGDAVIRKLLGEAEEALESLREPWEDLGMFANPDDEPDGKKAGMKQEKTDP